MDPIQVFECPPKKTRKRKKKRRVQVIEIPAYILSYPVNPKIELAKTMRRMDKIAEKYIAEYGGKLIGSGYDFQECRRDLEVEGLDYKEANRIQKILAKQARHDLDK